MNNCLADLSSLIPSNYLKKQGRGRIEKTEIIEMAIKHLKQLQAHHCKAANGCPGMTDAKQSTDATTEANLEQQYCLGYQECLSETMHFLVEVQVCYPGDNLCVQIMNHLQKHRERILKGKRDNSPSKESEYFAKCNAGSPDGSLPDRTSPTSFRPIVSNGHATDHCEQQQQQPMATPKVEVDACPLYGLNHLETKSCDVQMSEPDDVGECRGSQLREMLQNPSLQLQARARSMSASSSIRGFGDSEVYKFKRNIKERFKADQSVLRVASDEDAVQPNVERRFSEPVLDIPASGFRQESGTDTSSTSRTLESLLTFSSSSSSSSSIATEKCGFSSETGQKKPSGPRENLGPSAQREVPIFVLHPRGNFYVPMTVASSLVLPHLDLIPNVLPQLLHHVGLAVYFSGGQTAAKAPALAAPERTVPRQCANGLPGYGEGRPDFHWNTIVGPT